MKLFDIHVHITAKIILALCTLLCACEQIKTKKYTSPAGYDLSNPVIINLRNDLDEISGLSYYAKDTSLFAINDEQGVLYKIFLRNPVRISTWKFSAQGDYEDLVLADSTFYILQSDGDIKVVRYSGNRLVDESECKVPLSENNEFESLYKDTANDRLVMLCKDCETDNKDFITAYTFKHGEQVFSKKAAYQIAVNDIRGKLGGDSKNFKPSAAAIHPITGDLYIVSATANALLITDQQGDVKSAFKLNPRFFKQPEGLAFSPAGTLFISNEAAETGSGNILIFKYNSLK